MSKTKRNRRSGLSVSLIIALLFVASGVVRLFGGTGAAIAREVAALAPEPVHGGSTAEAKAICPDAPELERILEALKTREAAVAEREARVERKTQDLNEASAQLGEQMHALKRAESDLAQTIAAAETAAETDIAQLTSVYENMKPKEAAAVFQEMAPEFAAGFLSRMRSDAAARILAGLDPASAYSISVILASRNVDVPTE